MLSLDSETKRALIHAIHLNNASAIKDICSSPHPSSLKSTLKMMELLSLKLDADLSKSPLYTAVENESPEAIRILLTYNADVDEMSYGNTPLHRAVSLRNSEISKMLLEAGAKVDLKNRRDETAMQIAIKNKDVELAVVLVKYGADVNTLDDEGHSVLHLAAYVGDEDVVSWLMEKGADVNKRNYSGNTALHYAAYTYTGQTETLLITLTSSKSTNVNIRNSKGDTALHILSTRFNSLKAVQLLINHGADLRIPDLQGLAPFFTAVLHKNTPILRVLMYPGINLDFRYVLGCRYMTALHIAAYECDWELTKLLLENGAGVDVEDSKGHTPLEYLLTVGGESAGETLRVLLEHGASVSVGVMGMKMERGLRDLVLRHLARLEVERKSISDGVRGIIREDEGSREYYEICKSKLMNESNNNVVGANGVGVVV